LQEGKEIDNSSEPEVNMNSWNPEEDMR